MLLLGPSCHGVHRHSQNYLCDVHQALPEILSVYICEYCYGT